MAVERELQTLRQLHTSLDAAVRHLDQVVAALDEVVRAELWTGPQADRLGEVWAQQREGVGTTLPESLRAAVSDVRTQHNNLAAATGQADRL